MELDRNHFFVIRILVFIIHYFLVPLQINIDGSLVIVK